MVKADSVEDADAALIPEEDTIDDRGEEWSEGHYPVEVEVTEFPVGLTDGGMNEIYNYFSNYILK